jgi:hypothetical protein
LIELSSLRLRMKSFPVLALIPLYVGAFAPVASAEDTTLHAVILPRATTLVPAAPSAQTAPAGKFPAAHCDALYCGFDALQDIWKRDALKPDPVPYLNADTVIVERSRFEKEVERFGDPHAPAVFSFEIPGLGLCLTGLTMIHTC